MRGNLQANVQHKPGMSWVLRTLSQTIVTSLNCSTAENGPEFCASDIVCVLEALNVRK